MPFPTIANNGIINKNKTKDAPIKLPTKISGLCIDNEVKPIIISGRDVRMPKKKNDKVKNDIRIDCASRTTSLTIRPEANQVTMNAPVKNTKLVQKSENSTHLVYYVSDLIHNESSSL